MTTPDQQARTLREAIARQQDQRETTEILARDIARQRENADTTTESDVDQ